MINMKPTFKVITHCSKTDEIVKELTFDNHADAKKAYLKEKQMEAQGFKSYWSKVLPES